jgi:hypothetical protein
MSYHPRAQRQISVPVPCPGTDKINSFLITYSNYRLVFKYLWILNKFPAREYPVCGFNSNSSGRRSREIHFLGLVEADFDCDLKGGKAECPVTDSKSRVGTFTFSTLQSFVIDVSSTAPPSTTGKPNSSPGLSASRSGALRHWWARLYWSRTG